MPQLIEQKLSIGEDAYGRRVTMTRYRNSGNGMTMWRITTDPASQRDDGEKMDGLTDQNIAAMANALQYVQRL